MHHVFVQTASVWRDGNQRILEISMAVNADHLPDESLFKSMDAMPRRSRQTPTRLARNASALRPGQYSWGALANDRLWVSLIFIPDQKIQVDLWWNTVIGTPAVTLCFGLYAHSVEFGELSGNGFNRPQFHQKGFGTLAVNTAIQALQLICPPTSRIEGLLSNTEEDGLPSDDRNRLAEERCIFWSRFGVALIAQGPLNDIYLCGTVGALATLPSGQVAQQFPRFVSLASFSRTRPELA
jgi:hypothetical protein